MVDDAADANSATIPQPIVFVTRYRNKAAP